MGGEEFHPSAHGDEPPEESSDGTPDNTSLLTEGELNLNEILEKPQTTHPAGVVQLIEDMYPVFRTMWNATLTDGDRKVVEDKQKQIIQKAGDNKTDLANWNQTIPSISGQINSMRHMLTQWKDWTGPKPEKDALTGKLVGAFRMLISLAHKYGLQPSQLVSKQAKELIHQIFEAADAKDQVALNRLLIQVNKKQTAAGQGAGTALATLAGDASSKDKEQAIVTLREVNKQLRACDIPSVNHVEIDVSKMEELLNKSKSERSKGVALQGAKLAFCGITIPGFDTDTLNEDEMEQLFMACLSGSTGSTEEDQALIRRWRGEVQSMPMPSSHAPSAASTSSAPNVVPTSGISDRLNPADLLRLQNKGNSIAWVGTLSVQSESQIQAFGKIEFVTKTGTGYRTIVNCGTERRPLFISLPSAACGKGEGALLWKRWPRGVDAAFLEGKKHADIKGILHFVELDPEYVYEKRWRADGRPINPREPISYFQVQWRNGNDGNAKAWLTKTELSKISSKQNVESWAAERRYARHQARKFFLVCQHYNIHPDTMEYLREENRNEHPWLYKRLAGNKGQQEHDMQQLDEAMGNLGLPSSHVSPSIGSYRSPSLLDSHRPPQTVS
ncbi:hypothetical protein H2203_005269 [Taxawa tesnikishii (nom. ined.)]|nr:hypothetical protein H2203_005269 [Dothideales sp. JES 119]